MATLKIITGVCAVALALATSSCCNSSNTSCSKGDCDVWPHVSDHAGYGNPCKN